MKFAALVRGQLETIAGGLAGAQIDAGGKVLDLEMVDVDLVLADAVGGAAAAAAKLFFVRVLDDSNSMPMPN